MHAGAFLVGGFFLTGDADGVVLSLDLEITLVNARQLEDGNETVALLEHIDGRERTCACGRTAQPIALQARV